MNDHLFPLQAVFAWVTIPTPGKLYSLSSPFNGGLSTVLLDVCLFAVGPGMALNQNP